MRGRRSLESVFAVLVLSGSIGALYGCGSDDDPETKPVPVEPEKPSATVDVSVEFPSDSVRTTVNSVHVWILATRAPASDADAGTTGRVRLSCSALVGGVLDPYDLSLVRRGDVVSTTPATPVKAERVGLGPAL